MDEESRGAGARESGGELAADVARLSHAGDDDSPTTLQAYPAGAREIRAEARQLGPQTVDLDGECLAAESHQGFVREYESRGCEVHPPNDTAYARIPPLAVNSRL